MKGDVHFNTLGNRLVADEILTFLNKHPCSYPPKHGSWLNLIACAFSKMAGPAFDMFVSDRWKNVRSKIAARCLVNGRASFELATNEAYKTSLIPSWSIKDGKKDSSRPEVLSRLRNRIQGAFNPS